MSILDNLVKQWKQEHPEENEEELNLQDVLTKILGEDASGCTRRGMAALALDDELDISSCMYALFLVGASKYRDLMVAAGVDVVEIENNLLHNG